MRTRLATLIVPAALMAGCSLQPIFHRPAAPVSATFPDGEAYKYPATGEGGTMLPATEIGWRDFMPDPRLQRVIEIALYNNRDLRIAALNVMQVQAQYRIQRAQLYPRVDGFASYSRERTPGTVNRGAGGTGSTNAQGTTNAQGSQGGGAVTTQEYQ